MSDISVAGRLQLIEELRCGYSPERGDDDLLLFGEALTVIAAVTVILDNDEELEARRAKGTPARRPIR